MTMDIRSPIYNVSSNNMLVLCFFMLRKKKYFEKAKREHKTSVWFLVNILMA